MFKFLKEKLSSLFKKEEVKEEIKKEKKVEEAKEEILKEKKKIKEKQPEIEKPIEKKQVEKIKEEKEAVKEENKQELEYAIEEVEEKIEEKLESKEIEKEEKVHEQEKEGFFAKLRSKLTPAKFNIVTLDQETFNEFFEKLEELLLENNVALEVVDKIRDDMQKQLVEVEIKRSEIENEIKKTLRESLKEVLIEPFDLIEKIRGKNGEFVILFFGINGTGKTTTIAKIAYQLNQNKIPCVIAAADTFRAASIEQLKKHGEKLGIKIISQNYGSDPAAVAFDSISYAKAHGIKTVLIDTAGRMHTKKDLMRELEKIIRVCKPDLKIFVAESITGNDAVEQARIFNESLGVDAIILTKADVDEKGGTAISIGYITKKPIIFLGTGQNYRDLQKFSAEEILSNLGL